MKESFMANDFIKPSVSVRGNFDKNKVATIQDFIGRKDQYDPRVENIDKINTKIKQILNCLTEN